MRLPPTSRQPALTAVGGVLLGVALTACSSDGGATATDPASDTPYEGATTTCAYPTAGEAAKDVSPPSTEAPSEGTVNVTIQTSQGDLTATLNRADTPCTVNSFASLAEQGYFDDTQCHRLTTGSIFVLQCGDPTATGIGGPGYSFDDELSGQESYGSGTLAMANAGPNTNGSQFFIVYDDTQLPPAYAIFGELDEASVAIVQEVAKKGTDDANGPGDGHPKTEVAISGVTVG